MFSFVGFIRLGVSRYSFSVNCFQLSVLLLVAQDQLVGSDDGWLRIIVMITGWYFCLV